MNFSDSVLNQLISYGYLVLIPGQLHLNTTGCMVLQFLSFYFYFFPFFNYLLSVDWNNVVLKSPQTKNNISATFCHVFGGGLNRIAANLRGGPTAT